MSAPGLNFLPKSPLYDAQIFWGSSNVQVWQKPRGKSMCSMFLVGAGGGGGSGIIGANSTAAGGGGGGSGAQCIITNMPLALLPDILYVRSGQGLPGSGGSGISSWVSIINSNSGNNIIVANANGGGPGGNAAGATAGAAGAAGTVSAANGMSLGWSYATVLAGQVGIIGGTTGNAGSQTYPTTGLRVTGGAGGGGLGAGGANGALGGALTASAGVFTGGAGGTAPSAATTPPGNGQDGFQVTGAGMFWQGGCGGGSTHGTATGGGLVQARGGNGAIGCGGGGMGGALTASTAAVQAKGGDGLVIIWCY